MPWFPDFAGAAELVRRQSRAAGEVDPVAQYLAALASGDPGDLETVWPGEVVVYDPRAGVVRGHRELRRFVRRNQAWQAERRVRIETVAATVAGSRAVVEMLAHLTEPEQAWPVAVVAESADNRSVAFRSYCSQWPIAGRHEVRPPILRPGATVPTDVVGRYLAALTVGNVEAIVATFAPDGYLREPDGLRYLHRGAGELRSFFNHCFAAGGGIGLQPCLVTDDGVRCALEYNSLRWGSNELPPQAGLGVYERGSDGLLAAVRIYDDVAAPAGIA